MSDVEEQGNRWRLAPPAGARLAVVGGCGGIGRAVVRAAMDSGLRVAVLDLPRSMEEHPPPSSVLCIPLDATNAEQVERAFGAVRAAWGGLDGLVNLAGFTSGSNPVDRLEPARWEEVLDGSLRTTFLCCRAAIPLLRPGGGAIVNMSSGLSCIGRPGYAAYSSAKAGIEALTRILAAENGPGIRVNTVAPGAIRTAFLSGGTGRGGEESADPSRVDLDEYVKLVPAGRIGEPEDVAAPILFLLGEAASYISGQVLHINGGALMRG